jgi:hypothetical protein
MEKKGEGIHSEVVDLQSMELVVVEREVGASRSYYWWLLLYWSLGNLMRCRNVVPLGSTLLFHNSQW